MADLMLGTPSGVTAVGGGEAKISEISADGANVFAVPITEIGKFRIPQTIIFRVKSTGAVFGATVRNVVSVSNLGFVGYDGADLALVPGTHAVYNTDKGVGVSTVTSDARSNQNGGTAAGDGWHSTFFEDVESLRAALIAQDSGYFTTTRLNRMTFNDLVYAARVRYYPTTIR